MADEATEGWLDEQHGESREYEAARVEVRANAEHATRAWLDGQGMSEWDELLLETDASAGLEEVDGLASLDGDTEKDGDLENDDVEGLLEGLDSLLPEEVMEGGVLMADAGEGEEHESVDELLVAPDELLWQDEVLEVAAFEFKHIARFSSLSSSAFGTSLLQAGSSRPRAARSGTAWMDDLALEALPELLEGPLTPEKATFFNSILLVEALEVDDGSDVLVGEAEKTTRAVIGKKMLREELLAPVRAIGRSYWPWSDSSG